MTALTATKTAIDLFAMGYRVRAGADAGTLIVRNPAGVKYTVEPLACRCSCPAWGNCKHLRCIKALVLAQWSQVLPEPVSQAEYNHYEDQMFALISAWDAIERAQRAAEFGAAKEVAGVGADGWARLSNVRAA